MDGVRAAVAAQRGGDDRRADARSAAGAPAAETGDREAVYFAARALLCARREDLPRFDLTFRQFWGRTRQISSPPIPARCSPSATARPETSTLPRRRTRRRPAQVPLIERDTLADSDDADESGDIWPDEALQQALLYSAQERLRTLDFARFTEEELAAAKAMLATWEWKPGLRRTRRLAPARRGGGFDFPRTLRRAMRTEGVPYDLALARPAHASPGPWCCSATSAARWPPTRGCCCTSCTSCAARCGHAEVFVFGTRLTRITRQLRVRNVDAGAGRGGPERW